MKGFVINLEKEAQNNSDFRRVLYTTHNCQLVVMSLESNQEIGEEVHHLDQFIRVEKGTGKTVLNGVSYPLADGFAVVIPSGTKHNIINTGDVEMKLYTVYAPPEHRDGTVHHTKADAEENEEHFEGQVSEL